MMTGLTRIKVRVARGLCSPIVGRALAAVFQDRMPARGLRVRTDSPAVTPTTKAALFWRLYESGEIRFLERHLSRQLDVIELGSSLGVVSSHIARRMAPGTRLVCVEPDPRLIRLIETNVRENAPNASFQVIQAAIDYSAGNPSTVALALGPTNVDSRVGGVGVHGAVEVPALTLSAVLERAGFGDYGLVMDIEGAEAALVEHDAAALARCQEIICELHASDWAGIDALAGRIERLGFIRLARSGPVFAFRRAG